MPNLHRRKTFFLHQLVSAAIRDPKNACDHLGIQKQGEVFIFFISGFQHFGSPSFRRIDDIEAMTLIFAITIYTYDECAHVTTDTKVRIPPFQKFVA